MAELETVMKKIVLIIAGICLLALPAWAGTPGVGTNVVGASGNISIEPGAFKNINLAGSYGTFIQDGIMLGGGAGIGINDGQDTAVSLAANASYWMDMGGMSLFIGANIGLPVSPDFDATLGIDIGIAHWLADNYAITLTDQTDLGSVKSFDADNLTNSLVLGVATFY